MTDRDNRRIQRFDSDGVFKQMWGWGVDDGTAAAQVCTSGCQAGLPGNGVGQFGTGTQSWRLDVSKPDGTNNNVQVFVADPQNRRIQEFTPDDGGFDGTPADSFGVAGTGLGQFGTNQPLHVAVDADGIVYASDSNGSNRVQRYDTNTNAFRPEIDVAGIGGSTAATTGLEVDAATDSLYVTRNAAAAVLEFDLPANPDDPPTLSPDGPHGTDAGVNPQGLGANSTRGTLYVSTTQGGHRVFVIRDAVAPEAAIEPTTEITADSATFHGTVDANGGQTKYYFQYSDDGGDNWISHGAEDAGAGDDPEPVSHAASGLKPNTDYLVRLVAKSVFGVRMGTSPAGSFTTAPAAPLAKTLTASQDKPSQAVLIGRVNPHSEQTSYWFEWGSDSSYGNSIPVSMDGDAGSGGEPVVVSERITGLTPGSTYHFRIVAKNDTGPSEGEDQTFTACANAAIRLQQGAERLPDCRAYEQVSPIDKNNTHVGLLNSAKSTGPTISSPDGSKVAYSSTGAFAGAQVANKVGLYMATREDGWQSTSVSPPLRTPTLAQGAAQNGVIAVNSDFSKQVVNTLAPLTPDAVPGDANTYLQDLTTGAYTLMFHVPAGAASAVGEVVVDQTASHVVFGTGHDFGTTPAPQGPGNVYEYADGEISLVGILPDGTASALGSTLPLPAQRPVSDDGTRVYWRPSFENVPVYLREGDQTVTVSHGPNGEVLTGRFHFATPDGRLAFVTSADGLTNDASPTGQDLYRYDADSGDLTDLTPHPGAANVESVVGISDDGSYVYFQATGVLAPGAVDGQHNLYVWHDGQIRLIATLGENLVDNLGTSTGDWRVSPNGRYFGFLTAESLSGPASFPSQAFKEAYLYDYGEDVVRCVSCSSGAPPIGDAVLTVDVGFYGGALSRSRDRTRNVLNDGTVFFSDPDVLVAGDSNGKYDAYMFSSGRTTLISSGTSFDDSFFADASLDGTSAFILTTQGLVNQDKDTLYDLYSARVNGGLSSQMPVEKPACQGDGCQDEPTTAPPADDPPSSVIDGSGNPEPPPSCGALEKKADRKAARADRAEAKAKKAKKKASKASGKKAKRLKKKARKLAKRAHKAQKQATKAERKLSNCRSSK